MGVKKVLTLAIAVMILLAGCEEGQPVIDSPSSPKASIAVADEKAEAKAEIAATFDIFCDTSYIDVSSHMEMTAISIYDPAVVLSVQEAREAGAAPEQWDEIKSSLVELSGSTPLLQGTTRSAIYLKSSDTGEFYLTISGGNVLFDVFEELNNGSQQNAMTMGEKNALGKASDYLALMPFSHSGLIGQLEFEGFTTDEATFAADNCGADWNEQAAIKAQKYLDFMSFSRQGLIDQLIFEGFTQAQAEYGVSAVGY